MCGRGRRGSLWWRPDSSPLRRGEHIDQRGMERRHESEQERRDHAYKRGVDEHGDIELYRESRTSGRVPTRSPSVPCRQQQARAPPPIASSKPSVRS